MWLRERFEQASSHPSTVDLEATERRVGSEAPGHATSWAPRTSRSAERVWWETPAAAPAGPLE